MKELTTWEELGKLMNYAEITPTDVLFIVSKYCSDNVIDRLDGRRTISAERWFSRFNILNNYIIDRAMEGENNGKA